MKQSIQLDSGHYILSFKWAGHSSFISSSGMSVFWNEKKIFEVTASDKSVHDQVIPISVWQSGNYMLEFRGEGPSDAHGMAIANLRLKRDLSKPKPLPLPPAGTLIEEGNFIKNGNFNFPQIQSPDYEITKNLPGWTSNEIERGIGSNYNSNWGNVVVVALDGNKHNSMKQITRSVENGNYILTFDWAARSSYTSSSLSVNFNGYNVFQLSAATDKSIHSARVAVWARQTGQYYFQMKGEGVSVANMRLTKLQDKKLTQETKLELRREAQRFSADRNQCNILGGGENFIANGNFNLPPLDDDFEFEESLPGWLPDKFQRGIGSYFNSKWGNVVVVELDRPVNNVIRQVISVNPGHYILSFNWAARTQFDSKNLLWVYWINDIIFSVTPTDKSVHCERIPIYVGQPAILQLIGDGVAVTNFRFMKDPSK